MTSRTIPVLVQGEHLVPDLEPSWSALGRYGRANLVVTVAQVLVWAALLTAIDSRTLHWSARAAALGLFCLMMQGVFTMLHEFCHRNAHRNPRLNYLIGWLTSTMFGTAPTLLQVQHWGHHRRNRTEAERAEFIHDGESPLAKTATYYGAILGGIWLACFLFPLISPLLPYATAQRLARHERFNSFAAGFGEFSARDWRRMQIEGLWSLAFWGGLVWFGPWQWPTLAVAYAAFAFSWSSLQWIYHVHTPVHVVEGAYNLRAPGIVRMLFLNFNYNLTHHRRPSLPWQELHARSDLEGNPADLASVPAGVPSAGALPERSVGARQTLLLTSMRLAELVARYPNTRLATPADNARILDFFERTPMHTSAFDVQYTRRPDFFTLLRYQSDRAFVIITEDESGGIRSLATASLRPGWVKGQPTTIGYLGDLRVRFDRVSSGRVAPVVFGSRHAGAGHRGAGRLHALVHDRDRRQPRRARRTRERRPFWAIGGKAFPSASAVARADWPVHDAQSDHAAAARWTRHARAVAGRCAMRAPRAAPR